MTKHPRKTQSLCFDFTTGLQPPTSQPIRPLALRSYQIIVDESQFQEFPWEFYSTDWKEILLVISSQ